MLVMSGAAGYSPVESWNVWEFLAVRAALPSAIAGNATSATATIPNASRRLLTTAQCSSPLGGPPAHTGAICDDVSVQAGRLTLAILLTTIVALGAVVV